MYIYTKRDFSTVVNYIIVRWHWINIIVHSNDASGDDGGGGSRFCRKSSYFSSSHALFPFCHILFVTSFFSSSLLCSQHFVSRLSRGVSVWFDTTYIFIYIMVWSDVLSFITYSQSHEVEYHIATAFLDAEFLFSFFYIILLSNSCRIPLHAVSS